MAIMMAAGTAVAAASLAIASMVGSEPVGAQGDGSAPGREELEDLLKERDVVIEDLRRRVEELERKLSSVAATAPIPTPSNPPDARTAATAPPSPSSRRSAEAAP